MKQRLYKQTATLALTIFLFGCEQTTTKEEAITHFNEVYGIYHEDYQTNLKWYKSIMNIITDLQSGQIPDTLALTAIQEQVTVGQQSHKNSLDRLDLVKPIKCKNDILAKAKENIQGQITAQNDINSIIELLKGGIQENEKEEFKMKGEVLLKNAENIERWKDDLQAFRKEFNFTKEDTKAIVDKFVLDKK